MTVTIHGSINTRASRCLWALEELGVAYDWDPVSVKAGENRSERYLAINPSGKVPSLTDGPVTMSESLAINLYLAQRYGAGGLWPNEPERAARVLQWTTWLACEIEPHAPILFRHLIGAPEDERDSAVVAEQTAILATKFALLENALGDEYLTGGFTVGDINLAAAIAIYRNVFKLDLTGLPRINAWLDRCLSRPARAKVDAIPRG